MNEKPSSTQIRGRRAHQTTSYGWKNPEDTAESEGVGSRTKLRLLTEHEERDRAYRAAREHYISKHTTVYERSFRRREKFRTFGNKAMAVIGMAGIFAGLVWLYENAERVTDWWNALLESLRNI